MKKNRGIQKLAILVLLVLLGVFMFSNTIPYQQFIQKNRQLEIRVQSQKKSNGLDVGKAD
ncbi:TPA: PhrA family quorum-sensing system peptide [Streptococcus pneumoniae]